MELYSIVRLNHEDNHLEMCPAVYNSKARVKSEVTKRNKLAPVFKIRNGVLWEYIWISFEFDAG